MPKLTVTSETWLKSEPKQSSNLQADQLIKVLPGREFYFVDHEPAEGRHVKVYFAPNKGWETGYFWLPDIEGVTVEGNVEGNQPNDVSTPRPENRGKLFNVPGVGQVYANDPILGKGGNFYFYEAFRPDGHRIPSTASLGRDVKRGAEMMEQIRERLGCPIVVTSWHRPYAVNKRVGGSSRSQHLLSTSSVDWYPIGMSVEEAYRKLDAWWGSRGGLARRPGSFIHSDLRGYLARWRY